jgi:hypothetical protein
MTLTQSKTEDLLEQMLAKLAIIGDNLRSSNNEENSRKERRFQVELTKISLFCSQSIARMTTGFSATIAIMVGTSVLVYTLFYQNLLSASDLNFSLLSLYAVAFFTIVLFGVIHNREMEKVSTMIKKVNAGQELLPLQKLLTRNIFSMLVSRNRDAKA